MLRCGTTNVFLKPECVCSFYNVHEAIYHGHSSCPEGATSDIVTQLNCQICKKYSLNNNGPCINGGKLICIGEEVAPKVTCQCPPNYEGHLCENRIENVTRICDVISNSSSQNLPNCDLTSSECVTYSRNKLYVYKCQENGISQQKHRLPLCRDVLDTTTIPTEVGSVDHDQTEPGNPHSKAGRIQFADIWAISLVAMFSPLVI
uniref:Uncharacterized protein LOC111116081 n=1 Tax=Crassostrea virginica TaxID=6565 RepID=A0A8B8C6M6_CRAVI|nr:uncharacterized protein LOC111116081 [Crassostrea virginica]